MEITIEQLRVKGKEMGIKQAMNMKEETLIARMNEIENEEVEEVVEQPVAKSPSIQIDITKEDKLTLDKIGLKSEWLASIANRYAFDRFQYAPKFKAFRCYRGNNHIDWISVNDLGLLNVKKELTEIPLKHQNHNPDKQVIKLVWRN